MTAGLERFFFRPRLTQPLAVAHVTVVPMDAERLFPDHTVIIEDGVIRALAPSSALETEGLPVVDGSGKYLMPGLADMHVHYWDTGEFALYLANGVTFVRNMFGAPLHLELEQRVQRGELPGPHIITTSPIIDGPGPDGQPIWPGSALLVQPEQAGPLVRQYAADGYQQIKAYSQLTRETLQALGMASAEAGLRMTGHCPNGLTFEEAIAAGMTCFEHLEEVQNGHLQDSLDLAALATLGNIPRFRQLNGAIDYDKMRRLGHQMAAEHIWNCPTLVLPQQMSQDLTRALMSPLLAYESQATLSQWNPANDVRFERMRTTREAWASVIQEVVEVLIGIVAVFHEEGAPLLLGNDTPNPFVFQGFSVHQELTNLRSAGLTPFEALQCGTSEAARFVGQTEVWGTIAEGKRADLLLIGANPLTDVEAVRDIDAVFVNGFHFSRSDLAALLQQRAASVAME